MRLALNGATTMKADLATDVRAAGDAGFELLEIWAAKLRQYLKSNSTSDLKRLFADSNVKPYSINSIEHVTFKQGEARQRIMDECAELSQIASDLACPFIVVVPSPLPADTDREQVIAESVSVLNEMADIAEARGVSLAFEFLGQPDCSVPTLDLAAEIVSRVSRSSVGLVIDSFHYYAGGSTLEAIDALDPKRLFIFHINDAEDRPKDELQDRHRLLPGLGILPLREIIGSLRGIGYDGVVSIEIFRPEYWERDPFQLARDARDATERVLA